MKYVIFFPQGGIGKHIAATAVAENISKNFPDRKLIVICPYPRRRNLINFDLNL
jgi:uncharacterized phage-like protein YoqJ